MEVCPKWEENILFAMFQKEEVAVQDAVEKVRTSKAKLAGAKSALLRIISQQQTALDVFEDSLTASLGRLQGMQETSSTASQDDCANGFMLSQLPFDDGDIKPGRGRTSVDDDITTLHASASPTFGRDSLLLSPASSNMASRPLD